LAGSSKKRGFSGSEFSRQKDKLIMQAMPRQGYKNLAAIMAVMNGGGGVIFDSPEYGGKKYSRYQGFGASPAISPAVVPAISTMGRNELIGTINLTQTNAPYTLPTQGGLIPNDRFMSGIVLRLSGRVTNPGTNQPTGVQADGLYALLDTITIEGQHLIRGTREQFIVARGPDLRQLAGIYMSRFPNAVGTLSTTASAAVDFTIFLPIFFYPLGIPAAQQAYYLLDAPNYSNLKLTINYGDDKSIYTGQTTAPTFTAFGSGSGSPSIDVNGIFCQAGPSAFKGYVPGRMFLSFQENTSDPVNTATGKALFNLPTGFHVRSFLMKTGVKSTAVTSGNNSYNTLSDTVLSNLKWTRGFNKNHRIYRTFDMLKEDGAMAYALSPSAGFALMDYAQKGSLKEAMDATQLVSGATGDVSFQIIADVAGAANQAALILQQELRYEPTLITA
jgi:hypothetical protein